MGFARLGDEKKGKLYDELRKELDQCQKEKGKPKSTLNIACDGMIAVSSLRHDYFITTDRCLYTSWRKLIRKHRALLEQFEIPEIIYARRSPKEVAKRDTETFSLMRPLSLFLPWS